MGKVCGLDSVVVTLPGAGADVATELVVGIEDLANVERIKRWDVTCGPQDGRCGVTTGQHVLARPVIEVDARKGMVIASKGLPHLLKRITEIGESDVLE